MTEEPMACDRCGLPHERCRAHNRAGAPCGLWPLAGQRVCKMHGGKSPGALEKAEERVQTAAADAEIRKIWVGLKDAQAVADPVDSLARLAGALEAMLDTVGEQVNLIKTTAAGAGLAQVRGEIVLLERTASLLGRTLDSMARLGIAERQVQLQQEQAELVTTAFRGAVAAVAASVLLPADRDLMVRTFLVGLGRGPEQLEGGAA